MKSDLVVCVLNYCLRLTDSRMHAHVHTLEKQGVRALYILLNLGGEHKQAVDEHFATELPFPVHCLTPAEVPKLTKALSSHSVVQLVH